MKRNLIIASILLGGLLTVLPTLWRVLVFASLAFYLFVKFDEYDYSLRTGGHE